jgi:DNA-binding response OmpR family regulator
VTGPRILLVEDDQVIGDAVVYALEQERFRVQVLTRAGAVLAAVRADVPELVLLDLMLPDGSGVDVCRELRAESAVPIIMLTARSTELDRVLGLEVGADDYIVKPFSVAELVSRVRALLRRRELDRVGPSRVLSVGNLRVDLLRQDVSIDGRTVSLTPAEMRLLSTLAGDPDRAFTRDELMEALWDAAIPGASRACDTHVLNLRRKLDGSGVSIETVRGFGYRLRA